MLTRTSTLIVAALALSLVLVPGTATGGRVTVKAKSDQTWGPVISKVAKQTKVVWKNADSTGEPHSIKSHHGKWMKKKQLSELGDTVSKRFWKVKTYYYRCTLHSGMFEGECVGMCGEIRVKKKL